jgi:hypothetical protein
LRRRATRRAHASPEAANVALAATLHDATGALVGVIRRRVPALRRLYGAIAVTTSPPTAPAVNALLADLGVWAGSPRANTRGPLYRMALRRALASGNGRVHYLDFDRALHWVETRPRELAAVLGLADRYPALIVGRTLAAHRSHHRPLFDTERAVNAWFARRLRLRDGVDFLVPSFILTDAFAGALLRRSRAADSAIYGEWPALLATLGVPLAYVECRGLDWETPDRHRRDVRRLGLAEWRRTLDTAAEWETRRAMAAAFTTGFDIAVKRAPTRPRILRVATPRASA